MANRARTYLALLVLALRVPTLAAQVPEGTYGHRALIQFLARIRTDTRLPDSLRHWSPSGLGSLSSTYVSLDDSTFGVFVHAMLAALHQLPESLCARAAAGPGDAEPVSLPVVLDHVDSVTVTALLFVVERELLAAAHPTTRPIATPAAAQATIGRLIAQQPEADQRRFMGIGLQGPPSQADACWSGQFMFARFAELSPAELGPLMRSMSAPPPAAK